MTDRGFGRRQGKAHTSLRPVAAVLVALPVAALIPVPFYNRVSPRVGGIPFFYWYQLSWTVLGGISAWAAYALLKKDECRRNASRGDEEGDWTRGDT
ncbi:DUF3311 domain-containing protein [Streptomyces sp. NPDC126514]|uniref:DUF3311 domain-containing protein n=1 Tax=Streptomyces sp. NPDC126514 TaxID=3155210 RepID=UPI00332F4861